MADALWLAAGLVLLLEGLLPFLSPRLWREVFAQLVRLDDRQIRRLGAVCLGLGLILLWWR